MELDKYHISTSQKSRLVLLLGLLTISVVLQSAFVYAANITVASDHAHYERGDTVRITGTLTNGASPVVSADVAIEVDNNLGTNVFEEQLVTDANGAFATTLVISQSFILGLYTINAAYQSDRAQAQFSVLYKLTGTVTGSGGVPGCWVSLYDPDSQNTFGSSTDSSGYYEIWAPSDNNYIFDVWPPMGGGFMHHQERSFDLSAGSVIGHDITLPHGFYVFGDVSGSSPVMGAWVSVWDPTSGIGYGANTDPNGHYAFTAPSGSGYIFDIWPAMGSHVMHLQERGVAVIGDTQLSRNLGSGFYIYGSITGTGAVQGAWVSLYDPDTGNSWGWVTDANGHYQFTAPSDTNYVMDVWPPSGARYLRYKESPIVLTGDLQKNVGLQSGWLISGTVTSGGTPVSGVWVSVYDPDTGLTYGTLSTASGYGFGVPTVAKTNYVFDASPLSNPHLIPYHEPNFAVTADKVKNVVLVAGNILSGTVHAPGGTTPVPGAWVSLYNPTTQTTYGANTDSNGHYTIVAPTYSNYIFDVSPPSPYNHYSESSVALTADATKDVTLTGS